MQKFIYRAVLYNLMKTVGYQFFFTDYQIRHLGNPPGLPTFLLKINPCNQSDSAWKLLLKKRVKPNKIRNSLVTVTRQRKFCVHFTFYEKLDNAGKNNGFKTRTGSKRIDVVPIRVILFQKCTYKNIDSVT